MQNPRLRNPVVWAPLLALTAFFVFCGWQGADFGHHPDEAGRLRVARENYVSHTPFPNSYEWPSMVYDLGVTSAFLQSTFGVLGESRDDGTGTLLVFTRKVFVAVSSLAILWTLLMSFRASAADPWEPLLAAALFASCWEFQYHSRFATPDTVMAQFSAACAACLLGYGRQSQPRYLIGAAICAGLACATKYPAALWMVIILGITVSFETTGTAKSLQRAGLLVLVFIVAFLFITPGAIGESRRFMSDVSMMFMNRAVIGHDGYTVGRGLPHLLRIFRYLAAYAFSSRPFLSIPLFLCALVGVGSFIRRGWRGETVADRVTAWVLIGFPLLYLGFYILNIVLLARDMMILMPFLAVWAARGLFLASGWVLRFAPPRFSWAKPALAGLLIAPILIYNANWSLYAASTIKHFDPAKGWALPPALRGKKVWLTPSLGFMKSAPWTAVDDPQQADVMVFWVDDLISGVYLPANQVETYHPFAPGPFELNLNVYPDWNGVRRPIWVTQDFARRHHLYRIPNTPPS